MEAAQPRVRPQESHGGRNRALLPHRKPEREGRAQRQLPLPVSCCRVVQRDGVSVWGVEGTPTRRESPQQGVGA